MVQAEEHRPVVPQVADQEEVVPHELVADRPHALPFVGVTQEVADAIGRAGRNDEYLFYQSLVGIWPRGPPEEGHLRLATALADFRVALLSRVWMTETG